MRFVLIIGLMAVSMSSFSQAPGYMGRRLTVTAELSFFNALFHPNANFNSGIARFNHREIFDLDYIITRDGSVGFTFELVNTSMAYEGWNDPKFDSPLFPGLASTFQHARITGQTFGLNYKLYRNPSKGGIAPVGGYAKFDIMVSRTEVFPFDKQNRVQLGMVKEYYNPIIGITYGRQRILWNSVIIRTGIQIALVPTGVLPYFTDITSDIEHEDPNKEFKRVHDARMFSYYAVNVNVGIGFLAPFRHRPK